jgi:methionyl-tRNA formyltransferase
VRVVYFGTPSFAVPALAAMAADQRFEIALVVTQPDRPSGRGRKLEPPAVAAEARRLQLPLYQPSSLRTAEARRPLADADADVFVVAAFGLIFGRATLALPRLGCLNLHGSLLPRYRGASPVQAAILCGDNRTGITLMKMNVGLDTGDSIATIEAPVQSDDTTETLMARLAEASAQLAVDAIPEFAAGRLTPAPQPTAGASVTRMLTKADGWLDWNEPATVLARRVRAMWPWPRAWTTSDGEVVQVHAASAVPGQFVGESGAGRVHGGALLVACGDGGLTLDVVQPSGRRPMPGAGFAAGRPGPFVFGVSGAPEPMPPLVQPA